MRPSTFYLHLPPDAEPPTMPTLSPSRVVVIVEVSVGHIWRSKVSDWLVDSGCLYMLAWGPDCSLWDDSVDWANLEKFAYYVPGDKHVITTWHEDEALSEVFTFAKQCGDHPIAVIERTLLLHIAESPAEAAMLAAYARA
jgi:hypothetical protein